MNRWTAWQLIRRTAREFWNDRCLRLGAALAFYIALSLSPLFLIVIALAGLVYGEEAARGELVDQLRGLIGPEGAAMIETMLAASRQKGTGLGATLVGLATLLVGATGVFVQLQDALNTVWNTRPGESVGGIWGLVRDRLLSFSLICGLAFLLLVSLVLGAVVSALSGALPQTIPGSETLIQVVNFVLSFGLMYLMFAMIFKVLPAAAVKWTDVWIGAGLTTVLFAIGKHLIGLYLGYAAVGSLFGAAGSFVVLLLWLYYSSVLLLFGAEFTQVYSSLEGSGVGKATAGALPGSEANDTHPLPSHRPVLSSERAS